MSEETDSAVAVAETTVTAASDAVATAATDAAKDVAHDAERDTRSLIHRLWDDAEADIEKGLNWFKAEIAKL